MVSIPACHAGDPGSIPGLGGFCSNLCSVYVSVAFVAERLRRYVQVVVNFVGVGSSPTECSFFGSEGFTKLCCALAIEK